MVKLLKITVNKIQIPVLKDNACFAKEFQFILMQWQPLKGSDLLRNITAGKMLIQRGFHLISIT